MKQNVETPGNGAGNQRAAKLLLDLAETPHERVNALKVAMGAGIPLREVEDRFDWADFVAKEARGRVEETFS